MSFELLKQDFLALIGPNGGGKSTLLNLILNNLKPSSGKLEINAAQIGYVAQETNQNKDFPISVLEVVLCGSLDNKFKFLNFSKQDKKKAQEKLELLGIWDLRKKTLKSLSGGQRQRLMIARSLMCEPDLLLLDEPTSNVDPNGQKEIFELLKKVNEKTSIITVSHDISLLFGYAKNVLYVNKQAKMHKSPSSFILQGEHFCEVELIQQALKKED